MEKLFCAECEIEITNSAIIMRELTSIGYVDKDFCTQTCFIKYIAKKYKRKIRRLIE